MKPVLAGLSLMTCVMGCSRSGANADSSALRTDTTKAAAGVGTSTGVTTGAASGRIASADSLASGATPAGTAGTGSASSSPRGTGAGSARSSAGASRSGRTPRGASSPGTSPDSSRRDTGVTRSDAADTARGIIAVVGTSMDSRVIVRADGGARSVTLVGAQARAVGAMSGADVWVTGTRDQNGRITVSRFTVRSVDGVPALDGTLIARGAQLLLVTRDGKQHAIDAAPPALREHVGARVWVTGPLDKGPVTFGVIEERR